MTERDLFLLFLYRKDKHLLHFPYTNLYRILFLFLVELLHVVHVQNRILYFIVITTVLLLFAYVTHCTEYLYNNV